MNDPFAPQFGCGMKSSDREALNGAIAWAGAIAVVAWAGAFRWFPSRDQPFHPDVLISICTLAVGAPIGFYFGAIATGIAVRTGRFQVALRLLCWTVALMGLGAAFGWAIAAPERDAELANRQRGFWLGAWLGAPAGAILGLLFQRERSRFTKRSASTSENNSHATDPAEVDNVSKTGPAPLGDFESYATPLAIAGGLAGLAIATCYFPAIAGRALPDLVPGLVAGSVGSFLGFRAGLLVDARLAKRGRYLFARIVAFAAVSAAVSMAVIGAMNLEDDRRLYVWDPTLHRVHYRNGMWPGLGIGSIFGGLLGLATAQNPSSPSIRTPDNLSGDRAEERA